jgi:hypothetical protein
MWNVTDVNMTHGLLGTKLSPYFPLPNQENLDVQEAIAQFQVVFDWTSPLAVTRNSFAITS